MQQSLSVITSVAVQKQREKREEEDYAHFRKENPLIREQFEDLKRQLAAVSESEWKGIPEIGDYTVKRRKRFETFSAVSDNLLAGALANATGNTGTTEQDTSGFKTTDLTALGSGKKQMLGVSLDRMADSVSGQTTVDPTGYLTSLANKKVRYGGWCFAVITLIVGISSVCVCLVYVCWQEQGSRLSCPSGAQVLHARKAGQLASQQSMGEPFAICR